MITHFWYLATPYSKYPAGIEAAFHDACLNAAILIKNGIRVYSPIAHTHPIAMAGGIDPLDHDIWLPVDRPFMRAALGLILCKMDGWDVSRGIKAEVDEFESAGKPVILMESGKFPIALEGFRTL